MIEPPVRVLAPYQITHLVAVIQEARFENLFMKSCSVKTGLHGKLDVPLQRRIVRRRVDTVGIKALIQYKPLKNRFSVEQKLPSAQRNLAQSEIALHLIASEAHCDVI